MRLILLCFLAATCSGCSIIYKLDTRQGNVIEQKQLDRVQVGMTKDQIRFLLGTPIATDPFRPDRWDYFGYYRSPRGAVSTRNVTLIFSDDKLATIQGDQVSRADQTKIGTFDNPDVDTIAKQVAKDRSDGTRAASQRGKESGLTLPANLPQ